MSLTREATQVFPGYKYGDLKIAHYAISYTANAITKPTQDPAWMLLNGAVLSQTTYPILFGLFGSNFNTGGEGTGNFRLPDLTEGRVPIAMGLTNFTTLAASGGEISHALATTQIPSHSHGNTLTWTANVHSHTPSVGLSADGAHNHSVGSAIPSGTTRSYRIGTAAAQTYTSNGTGTTAGVQNNHYHNFSFSGNSGNMDANTSSVSLSGAVSNAGGGTAHNNMQPYIVIGGWLVLYG